MFIGMTNAHLISKNAVEYLFLEITYKTRVTWGSTSEFTMISLALKEF
jgi:hypothetical protein